MNEFPLRNRIPHQSKSEWTPNAVTFGQHLSDCSTLVVLVGPGVHAKQKLPDALEIFQPFGGNTECAQSIGSQALSLADAWYAMLHKRCPSSERVQEAMNRLITTVRTLEGVRVHICSEWNDEFIKAVVDGMPMQQISNIRVSVSSTEYQCDDCGHLFDAPKQADEETEESHETTTTEQLINRPLDVQHALQSKGLDPDVLITPHADGTVSTSVPCTLRDAPVCPNMGCTSRNTVPVKLLNGALHASYADIEAVDSLYRHGRTYEEQWMMLKSQQQQQLERGEIKKDQQQPVMRKLAILMVGTQQHDWIDWIKNVSEIMAPYESSFMALEVGEASIVSSGQAMLHCHADIALVLDEIASVVVKRHKIKTKSTGKGAASSVPTAAVQKLLATSSASSSNRGGKRKTTIR